MHLLEKQVTKILSLFRGLFFLLSVLAKIWERSTFDSPLTYKLISHKNHHSQNKSQSEKFTFCNLIGRAHSAILKFSLFGDWKLEEAGKRESTTYAKRVIGSWFWKSYSSVLKSCYPSHVLVPIKCTDLFTIIIDCHTAARLIVVYNIPIKIYKQI